jgi:2,3-diketo-5-methylthio-1-phosphopentane phosphatase
MAPLDLSRTAVFLDFDGTISTRDTGVALLERFAPPEWRAIDDEYVRGEIGSRVCLLDEWDLLPKDEALLRAAAADVPLDAGLPALVDALRAHGAELTVVSDGFGFYVRDRLADLGVAIVTNDVDWTSGALEFPNADRCCACSSCGTCKQAPIKDAKRRGLTTVLVGDGASDQKAALLVDVLFAKDALARWCDRAGVPYRRFSVLADVHDELVASGRGHPR